MAPFYRRRPVVRVAGYLVILFALLAAMGDPIMFIDIPTFLVVVGLTAWSLLLSGLGRGWQEGLRALLSPERSSEEALRTGLALVRSGRSGALAGGGLAAVFGLIRILRHLQEPAIIGPGMAMLLLGLFYAVVLAYFILLPLQAGAEKRLAAQGVYEAVPLTMADLTILAGGLALAAVTFAVLLV